MKKKTIFSLVLFSLVIMLATGVTFGQEVRVTTVAPEASTNLGSTVSSTQQSPQPSTGSHTFTFVNSEFTTDGKPIKGAPYSAQALTESKQTLIDGNRIVNTSTAMLFRDSEGRTRREQTLRAIGGVATGAQPLQTIMINDPVAGVSYTLDPATHTARKGAGFSYSVSRSGSGGTAFSVSSGGKVSTTANSSGSAAPPSATATPFVWSTSEGTAVSAARSPQMVTPGGQSNDAKTENLGSQTMEGVEATGVKTTFTIPAGKVGNDRPIEIVDERWYSKELQLVVMSRHSDPRSGETIYRLINISRTEPERFLFEVPGDYQIKERTALPSVVAPRKPEN